MRLIVNHLTRYCYDQPVRAVVQSHRLTPSLFDGQRVLNWQVTVSDGQKGGSFRDGAGDWVQGWTVLGPVEEITVQVTGEVETQDLAGVLRGHKELMPHHAYLQPTDVTEVDASLIALAADLAGQADTLSVAHELARRVTAAIAYVPGVTHAQTTAAEALARGEGVCQDHAHVLISMARHIGLPARYVSGYLHAAEDAPPHDAAHAWAEVHVSGLGWVGFDPANNCCPDDRYIRLGSGLDARDAAPIKGTARGHGTERLGVSVRVQSQQ
jgi:transglutaminase-like putative cysteine protease